MPRLILVDKYQDLGSSNQIAGLQKCGRVSMAMSCDKSTLGITSSQHAIYHDGDLKRQGSALDLQGVSIARVHVATPDNSEICLFPVHLHLKTAVA